VERRGSRRSWHALQYRLLGAGMVGRFARDRCRSFFMRQTAGWGLETIGSRCNAGNRSGIRRRSPRSGRLRSRHPIRNVIYVGSGEANIRGNVAAGNGIYKSVDAGKTWQHVWKQEGQIGTMVGTSDQPGGCLCGGAGSCVRAELRSAASTGRADGGKSWQQVLKKDEQTAALGRRDRTRPTRTSSSPVCGRRGDTRGICRVADPGVGSTRAAMAAQPGSSCGRRGSRKGSGERWGSPWRHLTDGASMR
jgi:hypothetical protein